MFNQTRLKLTGWYLLIIMTVSIFFSLIIHKGLVSEIERVSRMERFRIEREPFDKRLFKPVFLDDSAVKEIKNRILLVLISINSIILVSAGGLGYFLAGKTLRPISEMVEEQNRFISDASHELRTPLTSLKTAIEVELRDKKMDLLSAKKLIKDNLLEINRLQLLSDNLLQLTQYKSGDIKLKFEKISLKKIVEEAIRKINIIAKEKKIIIENKTKGEFVNGISYSLVDLFVILLDNSIKYGKISSKVIISTIKKNNKILIYVRDQGIGIEKKDIPYVFDRFYRADKSRSKSGYGLGLSIAKKIVESHKGKIEITSQVNIGTTVIISLPSFS